MRKDTFRAMKTEEQIISDDLIRRSDAIEVAYQLRHKPNDEEWDWWLRSFNAIPSADRSEEWVPCSERLPEPGSWAIWCSVKGIIQVARWKEDAIDHFFPDQGFFQLEDAVAWMPLPEPWEGTEDAK